MDILVANNHLARTGGTENYTYTIAEELLRLGHNVEYFTFEKGFVSDLLESKGIKFKSKYIYDLIIANHTSTIKKLHRNGFIIQTCHGIFPELEQPSEFSDAFVAITKEVHDNLKLKNISSKIILNGINCNRFNSKNDLNDNLKTVLSLCQSEEANDFIRDCCLEIGVQFIKADKFIENDWNVENLINSADLVVGIGRSAYDAMACGRTVLSYDKRPYSEAWGDGYLNSSNILKSIEFNCSGRGLKRKFDKELFIKELLKYDKKDGLFFLNFSNKELNIKVQVDKYLKIIPTYKLKFFKIKKKIILIYEKLIIELIKFIAKHFLINFKSIDLK